MTSGRRNFLQAAAVAPAAIAAAAVPGAVSAAVGPMLRRSHFQPLLGQQFLVDGSGARLRLVALESLAHALQPDHSFSAVFELTGPDALAQDTWELVHPVLGRHAVFLSPGDAQGRRLEAVFNRG